MRLVLPLLLLAISPLKPPIAVVAREMAPRPFIVSPDLPWAEYYFKISPEPKSPYSREKGVGFAYKIELGQPDKLLWKTEGWFADYVFLSCNGLDLVRIGNRPHGRAPSAEDLAVAFYHEGVLVKSYSTADLIKDASKILPTSEGYPFVRYRSLRIVEFESHQPRQDAFQFTSEDGVEYLFRVADGSIVSANQK